MIQKFLFKVLMTPFALLYGLGVSARNLLYRVGFFKSVEFNVPIISIGNLSMGGAGKTPHVEYLAQWLNQYVDVAVLSRGYKRKTKGFLEVVGRHQVQQVGDESLQYKRKYPELGVFVSESRVLGIPKILANHPNTQLIILDDAFQHRAVAPGLNILLTEFDQPFTRDHLLPVGRLREWRSAHERADLLVISKCPDPLPEEDRDQMVNSFHPFPREKIFFTQYRYGRPYHLFYHSMTISLHSSMAVLMVSAIANTDYLRQYVEREAGLVKSIEYPDHHYFTNYEIAQLHKQFEVIEAKDKIILTTEKDAVRLEDHQSYIRRHQLPIYVLPIKVEFANRESEFRFIVQNFLMDFKR